MNVVSHHQGHRRTELDGGGWAPGPEESPVLQITQLSECIQPLLWFST